MPWCRCDVTFGAPGWSAAWVTQGRPRRPVSRGHRRTAVRRETYDVLVVTAGAVTRTFAIPGLLENAIGHEADRGGRRDPRPAADCLRSGRDPAGRPGAGPVADRDVRRWRVLGGGGLRRDAVVRRTRCCAVYPEIRRDDLAFHLVEATGIGSCRRSVRGPGRWVVQHLRSRGGQVHLNPAAVRRRRPRRAVRRRGVRLRLDRVDGGERGEPGGGQAHRPAAGRARLRRPSARTCAWSTSAPEGEVVQHAWAAGDDASVPDLASPTPGVRTVPNAQHAVRQGKGLGANLVEAIRGGSPRPYVHHSLGRRRHAGRRSRHLPVPPDRHQGAAGLADAPGLPRAGRAVLGTQDPGPAHLAGTGARRPRHRVAGRHRRAAGRVRPRWRAATQAVRALRAVPRPTPRSGRGMSRSNRRSPR